MTSMVGFSNCCSSSSRPMPDSRRYATISLLSRMGNEYACTMVIGDRHTRGGLTTTKPQNPTKTQTHRTNQNPIHRNTIKEQLLFQLRQECKTRLRAQRRVCSQQHSREESRGGKQIFSNQWWTGFFYTLRFLNSQRIQNIRFSISYLFLDGRLGRVSKNSSKAVFSDPVLIDLRTVRYPQPVLVNNLYPKKIRIAFLN